MSRPFLPMLLALAAALTMPAVRAQGTSPSASEYTCPSFLVQEGAEKPSYKGELTLSPFTHHWSRSPEHRHVLLMAVDEQLPGNRLCGVSLFSNSFGQPTVYVYAGQQFNGLWGQPRLFLKLTAGVLYGYVGKYQDKVPLNHHGFSPGLIPALGYRLSERDSVQMKVLGTAGLMFSYGRSF